MRSGSRGGDSRVWSSGCVGLGHTPSFSLSEASPDAGAASGTNIAFAAYGRLDNRDELISELQSTLSEFVRREDRASICDTDLLRFAYLRWGESCVERLYGDWALAAWHAADRRLFLARDHFGNTALYYYADPRVFAFATSCRALLDLKLVSVRIDELYLAQMMIWWPAYYGERTVYGPLRRLPPAHCLTVTPEHLSVRQYWRLEDAPELHLPRRTDYVEAFRDVFDKAVRARLRSSGSIAATLSGGLDSSAVATTAALYLSSEHKRLSAFTSVPLVDPRACQGDRFGDELPYARAVARFSGAIDLHPIDAAALTPVAGIRKAMEIHDEPLHGAAGFYWLFSLLEAVRERGCRVLLTGQMGNAGVSWSGFLSSQRLGDQLRLLGGRAGVKRLFELAKSRVLSLAPSGFLASWRRWQFARHDRWKSAINSEFARRLKLFELMLNSPDGPLAPPSSNPRDRRFQILHPGRSPIGAVWAEMGAAYGLEMRDPTADVRVLAFTFGVPDHVFMDPETCQNRWLIRAAMQGRVPDEVRLNRKRGLQCADVPYRLRASAAEVDAAVDEIARGPAAEYVDVPRVREAWNLIRLQDSQASLWKVHTTLLRGIVVGLWVNSFFQRRFAPPKNDPSGIEVSG